MPVLIFIFEYYKGYMDNSNDPSIKSVVGFKTVLLTLILLSQTLAMKSNSSLKVYPIVDDMLQKIYLLNFKSQTYYLVVSCKEHNMLSVSIAEEFNLTEAPRFNIYGQAQNTPNMARNTTTFLEECNAIINIDSYLNLLEVRRAKNREVIFALADLNLKKMHNQFLVRDSSVKWGLGQRFQRSFSVTDGRWTIWNRDKPWRIDEGKMGVSDQTYGHQPIYLARQEYSSLYHLVYFKNTYGLMIQSTLGSSELVFNSVGGNIHFVIILGLEDPQPVLQQFHEYIGASHIPPFWSLGYHQSRWGYTQFSQIEEVVLRFNEYDLPLDGIWSDLQYMDSKMIFTINERTHPPEQIKAMMQTQSLYFIPLMDVGVSVDDQEAITMGIDMGVFFMVNQRREYYVGAVWPGKVYFIDYLHPNASLYWKRQLNRLYQKVNFSGLWLDMNEPSNFIGGSATIEPYCIQQNEGINTMTINVDLQHYYKGKELLEHREVHAYYGHLSAIPSFEFLFQHGRPFIITRSNSVGTGAFAGHWTGDNVANWQFLRSSINGNFLFQIFGIQMVGADICGFYKDTTQELCSRWMQLGAFYPFARNHNHQSFTGQQPYQFGDELLQTSRLSLKTRYALLKQLYSILLLKKGRGSFFRPLSFQFYSDEYAYEQETIQTQFLIGRYIMVAPILYELHLERSVYFPGDSEGWHRFQIQAESGMVDAKTVQHYVGGTKEWIWNHLPSAPPAFLRAGSMLLTNYPANRSVRLSSSFHIFAALKDNISTGKILGVRDYNFQPHIKKCIGEDCFYTFSVCKKGSSFFSLSWKYSGDSLIRSNITISSVLIVSDSLQWRSYAAMEVNSVDGSAFFQTQMLHQIA